MTNIEVTVNFLRAYAKVDVKEIQKLISSNFSFEGPDAGYNSKDSYLDSLNSNLP